MSFRIEVRSAEGATTAYFSRRPQEGDVVQLNQAPLQGLYQVEAASYLISSEEGRLWEYQIDVRPLEPLVEITSRKWFARSS